MHLWPTGRTWEIWPDKNRLIASAHIQDCEGSQINLSGFGILEWNIVTPFLELQLPLEITGPNPLIL